MALVKYWDINAVSLLNDRIISLQQNVQALSFHWEVIGLEYCSVFLLGRYNKYARDVPQSPWTIDNERKGRYSVEEVISEAVCAVLEARECKFHGCGREDIDVRCLGLFFLFLIDILMYLIGNG